MSAISSSILTLIKLITNLLTNSPKKSKSISCLVSRYGSQISEQSSYDGDVFINQQPMPHSTNIRHSSTVVYSTVPRANSRIDENNNKKPPPPPPLPPSSSPNTPVSTLRSQKSEITAYQRQQSTACKTLAIFTLKFH